MTAIVAVQVFSRYVLNYSLFWSEELARYLLVWLTFLGASAAYHRKVHPGVDAVYKHLPDSLKKLSRYIIHAVCIGFFTVMIVSGTQFAWFVRLQKTSALHLPKWIIFSIIPVSGLILLIHALVFVIDDNRQRKSG